MSSYHVKSLLAKKRNTWIVRSSFRSMVYASCHHLLLDFALERLVLRVKLLFCSQLLFCLKDMVLLCASCVPKPTVKVFSTRWFFKYARLRDGCWAYSLLNLQSVNSSDVKTVVTAFMAYRHMKKTICRAQ